MGEQSTAIEKDEARSVFDERADAVSSAVIRYHRALVEARLPEDLIATLTEDFNHDIIGMTE